MKKTMICYTLLFTLIGPILTDVELDCQCSLTNGTLQENVTHLYSNTSYTIPPGLLFNITQEIYVDVTDVEGHVKTYNQLCTYTGLYTGLTAYISPEDLGDKVADILDMVDNNSTEILSAIQGYNKSCIDEPCSFHSQGVPFDTRTSEIRRPHALLRKFHKLNLRKISTESSSIRKFQNPEYQSDDPGRPESGGILQKEYLSRAFMSQDHKRDLLDDDYRRRRRSNTSYLTRQVKILQDRLELIQSRVKKLKDLWNQNYIPLLAYISQSPKPRIFLCPDHPTLKEFLRCYNDNTKSLSEGPYELDALQHFTEGIHLRFQYRRELSIKEIIEDALDSLLSPS